MEEKIPLLIGSIILIILIVLWPIYFFSISMFSIIPLGTGELLFFAIVEIVLVAIMVILWEFYKRQK
jgi:hypothetical protein